MNLNDLNDEMLNELNIPDVKDGVKKVKDAIIDATKKATKVIKDEAKDNIVALSVFKRVIKSKISRGEAPTPEEFKKAIDQMLKDNPKLLVIAGIAATPGSALTLPIAMKLAKKFGINLAPERTF